MPIPEKEKKKHRIYAYLDKTTHDHYRLIMRKKGVTMAQAIRQGLHLYLENDGKEGANSDKMYDLIYEFMNNIKSYGTPSRYVRQAIKTEWDITEKGAGERELIKAGAQTPDHARFMKDVVPLLKEAQKKENFGLDHSETKAKEALAKTDRDGYDDFLRLKAERKAMWAGCKWKQKAEVEN